MTRLKDSRNTVVRQAVDQIREAIVSGHFEFGQRLVDKELCELTGASRTSVREAMRILEGEGIIESQPHRGIVVATPTRAQAQQIYAIRAELEAFAGGHAAERASEAEIEALQEAVDRFGKAVANKDLKNLVRHADSFYMVLLGASRDDVVAEMLGNLRARISILRSTSMSSPDRSPHSLVEMRAIAEAIARRDSVAAAKACRHHVEMAAEAARSKFDEFL